MHPPHRPSGPRANAEVHLHRVEHGPQYVELELEDVQGSRLALARLGLPLLGFGLLLRFGLGLFLQNARPVSTCSTNSNRCLTMRAAASSVFTFQT